MKIARRHPGFFLLAATLLACGLAAVTILFTVADALLLKPLAVPRPEELVRFVGVRPQLGPRSDFRLELSDAWRRQTTAFAQLGVVHETSVAYRDGDNTQRIMAALTSPEWLETFGVAGRFPGRNSALLSHRFWQSRYGGRPDVIGRAIQLHGQPFTIAGILPAGFNGATVESGPDVRVPLAALDAFYPDPASRRELDFEVVGRLKPGVSRDAARQEAFRVYQAIQNPALDVPLKDHEFALEPLEFGASRLRAQASGAVWFATGAAALLALMVCLNLSGLLLARCAQRETEFAVRRALGASRRQLTALVLAEVAAIVTAAALLGATLTAAGLRAVAAALPPVRLLGRNAVPMALRLDPDWRVLLFALAATLLALVIIALAPAWRATQGDLHPALRSARATAPRGRQALLTVQAALCTVLLLAAFAARLSLERLRANAGPTHLINADVDRQLVPGLTDERFARMLEQWAVKVRALPGVETASYSGVRRLRGSGLKMTIVPAGERARPEQFMNTSTLPAGAAYFDANGIRLLAGRHLTDSERYGKPKPQPVVVSEAFARLYGGPHAVLGRHFGSGHSGKPAEADLLVVGVATGIVYRSLRDNSAPVIYSPLGGVWPRMTLTVRTSLPAAALAPALRQSLREVSPDLTLEEVASLDADIEASLWNERAAALTATLFAALATGIIAAGLFAFVAFLATTRQREMGIRLALGAPSAHVFQLILRQGVAPVGLGIAAGLLAGSALARLAQSFLYGATGTSPATLTFVAIAMLLTALAACLVPAWRASRTSPSLALRTE